MRTPTELSERFRQQGLKLTAQRQVLFAILSGNETHPSAEAVHHAASAVMPGISLRTVYHTLTDLVAMGEIGVLDVGSGPTRFDPNTTEHHHSVCDGCGAIGDVYLDDTSLAGLLAAFGEASTDFLAESVGVVIRGRCSSCRHPASTTAATNTAASHIAAIPTPAIHTSATSKGKPS